MIQGINFDLSPMDPGEARDLTVFGAPPITIEIKCFVPPPPGKYGPCRECGTFNLSNGQSLSVVANNRTFRQGGRLEIEIRDDDGDTRTLSVSVLRRASGISTPTAGAAG